MVEGVSRFIISPILLYHWAVLEHCQLPGVGVKLGTRRPGSVGCRPEEN